MLRGQDGPVRKELGKLLQWLADEVRPDLVHLSNVMLAGLAQPLAERLGVQVVSTLSGEDGFLENLPAPFAAAARAELQRQAAHLDALVAMSVDYADFMAAYLDVPCADPCYSARAEPPRLREKRARVFVGRTPDQ